MAGSAPRGLIGVYALSGAAALAYQVVWYHAFVDMLGASGTTFLVVLCSFIGGLGLGAIASSRFYRFLDRKTGQRGLPSYGRTELVMTFAALVLLLVTRLPLETLVGTFPYREAVDSGVRYLVPSLGYAFVRIALTSLAVGIPCFLMGLTFPYLAALYPGEPRFPSRLYAANTFGACLAVLVTEFFALQAVGYLGSLGFAAAASLGIALWAMRQAPLTESLPAPAEVAPPAAGSTPPSLFPGIVSGFLCGGLQALVFLFIKVTFQTIRGTFALLSFLAIGGIFVASVVVHRIRPPRVVLLAFAWAGLAAWAVVWLAEPRISGGLIEICVRGFSSALTADLVSSFLVAAFQIFVPYLLWSTLLPDLCDRLADRGIGLSRAYGLNTLAFLSGVLIFGWALPSISFFYSARLFMWVAALLLGALTVLSWHRPFPWLAAAGLAAGTAIGATVLSREPELRLIGGLEPPSRLLAYRSTPQHSFWVIDDGPGGRRILMFDRVRMSGVGADGEPWYMRQMAHVPLLLHPRPERALLICFGVGVTADAIRKHDPVTRVDVVDLNPSVYALNRLFNDRNGDVLADPKLRLIADDGRQYLKLSRETYDFATMEPPPPLQPGIARLYSSDFYADLKARLRPGAIVSQWLPEYQLDQRATDLIMATFLEAFTHAFLFVGKDRELILVGSDGPFDFGQLARSLAVRSAVKADLARAGLTSPHQVLATILRTTESLMAEWSGAPVIRDGYVSLEAIGAGRAYSLHPRNAFWPAKPTLGLDREDVRRALSLTAPGEVEAVAELWEAPKNDRAYSTFVPLAYLKPDS